MKRWIQENKSVIERDILADFCNGVECLFQQFDRFENTGTLSFSALNNLVGVPLEKGLLWRLKDSAHFVLRDDARGLKQGAMLDWCLGYIFHEVIKLVEDSRLLSAYVPKLAELSSGWSEDCEGMIAEFGEIEGQTKRSISLEMARTRKLVRLALRLFCEYFHGNNRHRLLARFLNDNFVQAQRVFGDEFPAFLLAIYQNEPEILYIEAACSLMESGRLRRASAAVAVALALNPHREETRDVQRALQEALLAKPVKKKRAG